MSNGTGNECKIIEKETLWRIAKKEQQNGNFVMMKCKKRRPKFAMWSNPVVKRKIENMGKKHWNNRKYTVKQKRKHHINSTIISETQGKNNRPPLWIWLISQSYSFSFGAQMLHLWITIKRGVIECDRRAGASR